MCDVMGRYVNMESFFDNKGTEEKFNHYLNGIIGLILDTHKVKWEHTTKISGNGEEYQSIEIIEDDSISKEDNSKADLGAQDYDVFGENKI